MAVGAIGGRERVEAAIRRAADATGVDFDFLLKTARRESSLNPGAKARTSSATGLFQFIEQTWLSTLKAAGGKHGYGRYAAMIQRGADGKLCVADPEARRQVLDLRLDAQASAVMGAELAANHAAYLRGRIGREPTGGELYAAHFLGPAGSAKLIQAQERAPGASAAALFPAAARANRSIFYAGGAPCSVASVYARLTGERRAVAAAPTPVARAVETVRETVAPVAARVREAVETVTQPVENVASALRRADKSRLDDMLIQLVMGDDARGAQGAAPFSTELLMLLSGARER